MGRGGRPHREAAGGLCGHGAGDRGVGLSPWMCHRGLGGHLPPQHACPPAARWPAAGEGLVKRGEML